MVMSGACDRCGPKRRGNEYDQQRGSSTERGYDYRWQQFRLRYLAQHPLCVDCEMEGIVGPATDVHHTRKLRDHPEAKYDEDTLMVLCKKHHDLRTRKGE